MGDDTIEKANTIDIGAIVQALIWEFTNIWGLFVEVKKYPIHWTPDA